MKTIIINGSPRYKKSNSDILINHFLTGYNKINVDSIPVYHLANLKNKKDQLEAFQASETVIIIFPLYTDCMPGIVKAFFEDIVPLSNQREKKIGFIVQSGFPEAIHSVYVERYLEKLVKRLGCIYLGTVIKGGVEGIKMMPTFMTRKLFQRFEKMGEYFAKSGMFSPKLMQSLYKPYRMSFFRRIVFSLMIKTGVANLNWDNNLKKNGVFSKSFDKPYLATN